MEEKIAEILRGFARRFRFDEEGGAGGQPQAGDGPGGLDPAGPGRNRSRPGCPAAERVVVVLPGPPRELRPMWPRAIESRPVQAVLARATPLLAYTVRMFGIPESEIAKSLREIEAGGVELDAVEITTCLRRGEIEIDVSLPRRGRGGCRVRCGRGWPTVTAVTSSAATGETIDAQLARLLQGRRLGLAESCSGGLLAARITDLPGASDYFAGGVVAYSNEAKAELLGVDPGLIEAHGAVSAEVAEAMSRGALERFGADVAVSITGIAGPDGAARRSRLATSASTRASPTAPRSAAIRSSPAGREDVRERSALVAIALAAHPARRPRRTSVAKPARTFHIRVLFVRRGR
jgi:nicotinamide-nucleotide amidase